MSKFGELINVKEPLLLDFYTEWNEQCKTMSAVLNKVSVVLGDKAKIVKIDIEKNRQLAEALRVKGLPTLIIYKEGEMKWRQIGEQDANMLINLLQSYA